MTISGADTGSADTGSADADSADADSADADSADAGSAIAFLHGLGGTRLSWEDQLTGLGTTHRCLAWDMPSYGNAKPLDDLTFEALADSVAGWLDEAAVASATVVGLSLGGMIAQHFALRHPNRVDRLVLVDTSPAFGMDGTSASDWLAARLAPIGDGLEPADFAAQVLKAIAGPHLSDATLTQLTTAFSDISADAFSAACRCLVTHDVRQQLGDITAPTLVIVGELDEETPLAYSKFLADGIKNARLEIVAGAAHLTPSEQPQTFNSLLGEFAV